MEQTHKLLEDMAHQPIQYWGAAIVLGSVVGGYIAVRRMVHTLREEIKELENKLFSLLEEQRKRSRP
jgi:hypothetical protein